MSGVLWTVAVLPLWCTAAVGALVLVAVLDPCSLPVLVGAR